MKTADYKATMALIEEGQQITQDVYDELVAFAKKAKRKAPKPECVRQTPALTKAVNKGTVCAAGEFTDGKVACDAPAVCKGMCNKHYTTLIYRADPTRRQKARDAANKYAAKQRALKAKKEAK